MDNQNLVDEYVRTMNGSAENTIKQYRGYILRFSKYIDKDFSEASISDVMNFLESLKSKKNEDASNTTKNVYIFTLRGFYSFLLRTKRIQFNPWSEIQEYKVVAKKKIEDEKILSVEETKIFARHMKRNVRAKTKLNEKEEYIAKRDYALFTLMLHRGFRVSELLDLEVHHLDMKKRLIYITNEKSKTNVDRTVGIGNDRLFEILNDYMKVRDRVGLGDNEYVFLSIAGNKLTTGNANRNLKKYVSEAGIVGKNIHCHMLRHTAATTHIQNHSIHETALLLGHGNYNTTKLYAHNTIEQIRNNESNKILDAII